MLEIESVPSKVEVTLTVIIEIMFLVIHLSFVHHVDTKLVLHALHCNIRFAYTCVVAFIDKKLQNIELNDLRKLKVYNFG